MVPGAPQPQELISPDLLHDFIKHFKAADKCRSVDDFNIAMKTIPEFVREKVAQAYELLRSAGWYGIGVNNHGNIKWRYVVDSRPRAIRELEGREFTPEECKEAKASVQRRMARRTSQGGMPKCKPWDYEPSDSGR